jgi:hypothetical protein
MDFRTCQQTMILFTAQIVRSARRLIVRPLAWSPSLQTFIGLGGLRESDTAIPSFRLPSAPETRVLRSRRSPTNRNTKPMPDRTHPISRGTQRGPPRRDKYHFNQTEYTSSRTRHLFRNEAIDRPCARNPRHVYSRDVPIPMFPASLWTETQLFERSLRLWRFARQPREDPIRIKQESKIEDGDQNDPWKSRVPERDLEKKRHK